MPLIRTLALTAGLCALASSAAAAEENPYGTPDQLKPCIEDHKFGVGDLRQWNKSEAAELAPACKAEIERRVRECLKDPEERKTIDDPQYNAGRPDYGDQYCHETAYIRMRDQAEKYADDQKAAKQASDDKAKVAAQRMPPADLHNAAIEKSIANTFRQAYPDHKIIKVILTDKSWDYDKDAFGRIIARNINGSVVNKHPDGTCEIYSELWSQKGSGKSYKGPFEERGAGSLNKVEILCENAK